MFSKIRKRFTYTNVALTLALVFAMSGGAYAASKYAITSTKQISPKVLKTLKGKEGPAGKEGPTGKEGGPGKEGPTGKEGGPGKEGLTGKEGPTGKEGKEGKEGKAGQTGFTETLPPGKTETGTWAFGPIEGFVRTAISFPIPLKAPAEPRHEPALAESKVHFLVETEPNVYKELVLEKFGQPVPGDEVTSTQCLGSADSPEALPGNLCVYASIVIGEFEEFANPSIEPFEKHTAGTAGITMNFKGSGAQGLGTWAVTAPEEK